MPPSAQPTIFCRIAWMRRYNGLVRGDEQHGGGSYIDEGNIGYELFNFADRDREVRGYVRTVLGAGFNLERIETSVEGDQLDGVRVIFLAPHPDGFGQVVVGWYRNATVHRQLVQDKTVRVGRKYHWYNLAARTDDACLLPLPRRKQLLKVGKGALGQANVWYPLRADGSVKPVERSLAAAMRFVDSYNGPNLLLQPTLDVEEQAAQGLENVAAAEHGAGFIPNAKQRAAIERHAMRIALAYFEQRYPGRVEDVGAKECFDLRCSGSPDLRVEVKGTMSDGATVFLTRNEVELAKRHDVTLFVVHSIKVGANGKPKGGVVRENRNWGREGGNLVSLTFRYELPASKG